MTSEFFTLHAETIFIFGTLVVISYMAYLKLIKPMSDEKVKKAVCLSEITGKLKYIEKELNEVKHKQAENKKVILDRFEKLEDRILGGK